jgi:hypothetical protein
MFPQTHVYFASRVLGKLNDAVVLGSIFPDIAIGAGVNRDLSHGSGLEMLEFLSQDQRLVDFALANITHGVNPDGLDYYSDELHPPFEKGYCFEKARPLVEDTVYACNIPPEMGWWKAHNIIEMGIELLISSSGNYGQIISRSFENHSLISDISEKMGVFYSLDSQPFMARIKKFPDVVDSSKSSCQSLALKYNDQMLDKHNIQVKIPEVGQLILEASEIVKNDFEDFFNSVTKIVKNRISSLENLHFRNTTR